MNDDKLKLSDYLVLVSKFESEPDNQEILKQIDDFLSKLIVREYMPLKEKEIAVMFILNNLNKDFDAAGASAFLEIGKVTEGLLSYCINLEKDISAIALGYYLVDSIYKYGLYSTIFNKCEKDCTRLFNMVDNAVNVSNIYRLLETASLFNADEYDKWLASMNELKDTLDSKSLQEILDVLKVEADTDGADIVSQIKKAALDSANKEYEAEAEKFKKATELRESPKNDVNLGEKIN